MGLRRTRFARIVAVALFVVASCATRTGLSGGRAPREPGGARTAAAVRVVRTWAATSAARPGVRLVASTFALDGSGLRRAYVAFRISELPPRAEVLLELERVGPRAAADSPFALAIARVEPFDARRVTHRTRPLRTSDAPIRVAVVAAGPPVVRVDVTELVARALRVGAEEVAFELAGLDGGAGPLELAGGDAIFGSARPRLRVVLP